MIYNYIKKYKLCVIVAVIFTVLISSNIILHRYYLNYRENHLVELEYYSEVLNQENFNDKYYTKTNKDERIENKIDSSVFSLTHMMLVTIILIGVTLLGLFIFITEPQLKPYFISGYTMYKLVKIFIRQVLKITVVSILIYYLLDYLFNLSLTKMIGHRVIEFLTEYSYLSFIGYASLVVIITIIIFLIKRCLKNNNNY